MKFEFYITFMTHLLLLCVDWLVAKQKSDYCLTHVDPEFPHYLITPKTPKTPKPQNPKTPHVYTNAGKLNLFNQKHEKDMGPIASDCKCPTCQKYSRAYIRHLLKAKEMLGMRLCVMHNLHYFNNLMTEIRDALDKGEFATYKKMRLEGYKQNK